MLYPEKGIPVTFKLTTRYNNESAKINQDRCLCYYEEKTNSLILGVFDGHGEKGHVIAEVNVFCGNHSIRVFVISLYIT